jgi:hypothetical protein
VRGRGKHPPCGRVPSLQRESGLRDLAALGAVRKSQGAGDGAPRQNREHKRSLKSGRGPLTAEVPENELQTNTAPELRAAHVN